MASHLTSEDLDIGVARKTHLLDRDLTDDLALLSGAPNPTLTRRLEEWRKQAKDSRDLEQAISREKKDYLLRHSFELFQDGASGQYYDGRVDRTVMRLTGLHDRKRKWRRDDLVLEQYQADGIGFMSRVLLEYESVLLLDAPGLGKVVQVLGLMCYMEGQRNLGSPHLVVATQDKITDVWIHALQEHAIEFKYLVYDDEDRDELTKNNYELVFVTPDTIITQWKDLETWRNSLNRLKGNPSQTSKYRPRPTNLLLNMDSWQMFVVDDVHQLQDHTSEMHLACLNIRTKYRVGVSAKLDYNNTKVLGAMFRFLKIAPLDNTVWFNNHFVNGKSQSDKDMLEHRRKELLSFFLDALVLRRKPGQIWEGNLVRAPESSSRFDLAPHGVEDEQPRPDDPMGRRHMGDNDYKLYRKLREVERELDSNRAWWADFEKQFYSY